MDTDTVRFSLVVRCEATIEETWELNLPANATEEDAMEALANPGTDTVFISDHGIGNEEDREFVSMAPVQPVEQPEHPAYERLVELRDMVRSREEITGFDRGLIMAYDFAIDLLDQHGRV